MATALPKSCAELKALPFYRDLYQDRQVKIQSRLQAKEPKSVVAETTESATPAHFNLSAIKPQTLVATDLIAKLGKSSLVLVAQYQTLPECRVELARILESLSQSYPDRPLAVAIDNFPTSQQELFTAHAEGRINPMALDQALGIARDFGVRYNQSLQPLFKLAAQKRLSLLAADAAPTISDLNQRDQVAGEIAKAWLSKNPHGIVFILLGEQRLLNGNLPTLLKAHQPLQLMLAWDEVFWRLGEDYPQESQTIFQWREDLISALHVPPLVKLDSFLTWSEHQEAWPGWPADGAISEMRALIIKTLKLPSPSQMAEPSETSQVFCCADLKLLHLIQAGKIFTEDEGMALLKQMTLGESYYLPRLQLIYLDTLNGYHMGEEIGHSIRITQLGEPSLERGNRSHLSPLGVLYFTTINEAAGYLASKIITPGRKPGRESMRLCKRLAEGKFPKLEGASPERLLELSHLAGYGLGEMLFRAMQGRSLRKQSPRSRFSIEIHRAPTVTPQSLHPLFNQPLTSEENAKELFKNLYAQLTPAPLTTKHPLSERLHWVGFFYFLFFFLPAVLWGDAHDLFRFPKPFLLHWQRDILLALGATLLVVGLSWVASKWVKPFRTLGEEIRGFLGPLSYDQIFLLAAFSGIGEEFLFRGALQGEFGWEISALFFGLMHFVPDRKFLVWPLFALLVGLLLSWIYIASGNLLVPVVSHFLINAINLILIRRKST